MLLKTSFKLIFVFFLTILVHAGAMAQTWPGDTIHVNINTGNPAYPFPQFLEYGQGKSLAANNAVGVTHADMEKAMREAYQIMMRRALYVPGKTLGGTQYIQFNNNTVPQNYGTFVSEGDGYALLAAAYFADKTTFDGLWMWIHDNRLSAVKKYLDCTPLRAGYPYGAGFAGWNCTDADGVGATSVNSAGDGDVDIAMALLIASKQWPAGSGITDACGNLISYKAEALKMIKVLVDTLYYTTSPFGAQAGVKGYLSGIVGIDGYIKSGNTWGEVTNWRYTAANTTYPWALAKPDPIQVNSPYVDYNAPAYFEEFGDFLAANGGTAWEISQCRRCAASGDWTIGQMYGKGYIASAGNYTVSDNGATTTFGSFSAGEDFRCSWRTILNYVWHGNPATTWNAATHQITAAGNTFEYDMAMRQKDFLKYPNSIPGTVGSAFCSKLGASPDPGQPNWRGVAQIKQQYASNGSVLANYGVNWMVGTGIPSAVASGDLDLTAELYRQCELLWDDQSGAQTLPDYQRYIGSTPKYFHGWFRTLGMLTASGNLQAPDKMIAAANVKVYMAVNKTFAYEGDQINYTVSYRNYGAVAASGVTITTTIDPNYTVVSAAGGSVSGNTITWSIGTIPGFVTGGLAATQGTRSFVVKVNPITAATVACLTSTITASNAPSWTSNEYPNNATYTMERNCVDLLKDRSLAITKTTDRSVMNSGDIVNFTLNFENKSGSNLWLNGGRDRVILSYANYHATGGTSFYQFYRIWHTAHEAYINLGNYRVSYFMNDAAAIGQYAAGTNPTGWSTYVDNQNDLNKYGYNPLTLPVNQQLNFTYQAIPWGSDANGAWNQRVITQFAQVLSATSMHIFDKLDSEYLIHKGVTGPGFTRTRFESNPSSDLGPRIADDWSYDPTASSPTLDGQGAYFFPVTPSFTDATTSPRFSPVVVTNYSKDACGGPVQNFSKVLFEEFDGYTWRRIAGNGPLPGRETYNVTVTDSIPIQLAWNSFTNAVAVGITATYTPLTGNAKFSGYVKWTIPVMLVGQTGQLTYSTIAKSPCAEQTFINAGWIWSDVDSPDSSAVNLKLTCTKVPPTPPAQTSLVKTADKTSAVVGDVVTYTLTYTNKDGSTASWAGASTVAADWQALGSGVIPKLTGSVISLDQNGGNTPPGTYGYAFGPNKSYGVNGWIDATIVPTNSSTFSFIYRYQSGTPGQANFVGLRLEVAPNIGGNNNIAFTLYQNNTAIATLTGLAFPGSSNPIKIKTQLLNDSLYIWVNNYTGAPLKVITGITQLSPGYTGLYGNGSQQTLSAFTSHFDAAFNLVLTDPVPSQLNNVTAISNGGTLTGSTITWPTVGAPPTPILANAVITRTFTATVNTCTDFITNIATANEYGVSNIQAQYVVTCGATCTKPTITSATTGTVCSGVAQNYAITSSLPSTYSWSRPAVTGITNAAVTAQTTATITETLVNSTTAPITVVYSITPTSTAQTCVGVTSTYSVTVNPSPVITSATTGNICSGAAQSYTITSNVPSSYTWSRAAVTGISNTALTAQTTNPITEALTNTTAAAIVVRYVLTPTSTTGSCIGAPSNYDVTVNPKPAISSAGTGTVCSGVAQSYTIISAVASTYSWSRAAVTGVSNTAVTAQTTNPITETLTNTTTAAVSVTYVIVPTSTTGSCAGAAFNYVVAVNPSPVITSATTGIACSGVAQSYTITSSIPSSYSWSRAAVTGVSNAAVTAQTTNPITETLTNTTTAPVVVRYVLTPTATTGGCVGAPSNYDVTVNPTPAITSASTGIICSGVAQNYAITSNVASSYSWTRAVVTGISNAAGTGTASPVTETLTNTTAAAVTVTYIITPTSTTGSCAGTPFNYVVTVNPAPTITSAAANTICSGTAQSYAITSNITSTYKWSRAAVTDISNAAVSNQTASTITETLTNTTGAPVDAVYTITPTATTGTCAGIPFTYTVTVNPTPAITSASTGIICSGAAQNYAITSNVASSYSWTRAAVTGISNAAGSGTASPVTETLTNTTSPASAVNVTYIITPTSTTGSCAGTPFNYKVTVNPVPTITSASTGSTCTGVALSYTITSDVASSYSWTRATATGINEPGTSGTSNPIAEVLTGSGTAVYTITPTSITGTCVGTPFTYTVSIGTSVLPAVTLSVSPGPNICAGSGVVFTAAPDNGGTAPVYKWYVNGALAGVVGTTYLTSVLSDGDEVQVYMTSNSGCASTPMVASNIIKVAVIQKVTPAITISADTTKMCAGGVINFSIQSQTNQGINPTYQWRRNGTPIAAATGTSFSTSGLTPAVADGDIFDIVMKTDLTCVTAATGTSNGITVTVIPAAVPTVSIAVDKTSICASQSVVFTATTTNEGTTGASYVWKVTPTIPGGDVTTTTKTYSPTLPNTTASTVNYSVTVELTSTALCASPAVVSAVTPASVAVSPNIGPGSLSGDESVCSGSVPNTITEASPVSGSTGTTYTWASSVDNGATWSTIAGATGTTLSFSAGLSQTTLFKRIATDGVLPAPCNTAETPYVTKTVIALPTITSAATGTICSGAAQHYVITSSVLSSYIWSRAAVSGISPSTGSGTSSPIAEMLTSSNTTATDVTYVITPTSTTGNCVGTPFNYTVTINPTPHITSVASDNTCSGVAYIYNITSDVPSNYTWTRATATGINEAGTSGTGSAITETLTGSGTANYIITAVSSSGSCTGPAFTFSLTVTGAGTPTATVSTATATICAGYPATFTATSSGSGTWQWYQTGTGAVAGATNSTYTTNTLALSSDQVWAELTSNTGCGSAVIPSNKVSVTVKPVPNPVISPDTIIICSSEVGGTFTSSGTATGSALQWYLNDKAIPGATATSYYATQSGNYSVSEDNGYCSAPSEHAVLTIIPSPQAYAGEDMYVQQGAFVQLQATGGTTGTQYSWTPSTGLNSTTISNPSFKADQTITYVVTLTNADAVSGKSCKNRAAVTITVVQPIVVPNVITINGDGANDTWHILHIEGYPNATFEIYNRWGNLVWKSTGYPKEWDGTNFRNGEVLPDGTYFYIINLHSQIYTEAYTGWVQIVK